MESRQSGSYCGLTPNLQLPLLLCAEVERKTTFTDPLAVMFIQLDVLAQRFRKWNEIGAILQCP